MTDRELYLTAKEAMAGAYAPYSGFSVGAAVLTGTAKVYTGVNIENAAYGASLCAERSALSAAVSGGHRDIEAVAVASSGGTAYPCGTCRQFIFEFGGHIRIIVGDDEDHLVVHTVKELLPNGFGLEIK